MHTPTQNMKIEMGLVESDIGGTNDQSKWVNLALYGAGTFIVQLGNVFEGTVTNWDTGDPLSTFKLQQATTDGGSAKDITGASNDQSADGSPGDTHAITVNSEALDVANGYKWVRAYVAEADNTGTDKVQIMIVRHAARFKHDDLGATSHVVV